MAPISFIGEHVLPIKDFKCSSCEKVQERICKTYTTELKCKYCNELATALVSSPKGFAFNCSGFYETDYKGK